MAFCRPTSRYNEDKLSVLYIKGRNVARFCTLNNNSVGRALERKKSEKAFGVNCSKKSVYCVCSLVNKPQKVHACNICDKKPFRNLKLITMQDP